MAWTKRIVKLTALIVVALGIQGCLGGSGSDGAPMFERNVSRIPNAKPKSIPPSKTGNPRSYSVFGKRYYVLESSRGYDQVGHASWYGTKFHGRKTSSGEKYNMFEMTAAHKTLPIPTYVKVKNVANGRSVIVKVTDRGPFHDDRIIDLSYAAAKKLGIYEKGTGRVRVTALPPYQERTPKLLRFASRRAAPAPTQDLTGNEDPGDARGIFIQMGAFDDKTNAISLLNRAKSHVKSAGSIAYDPDDDRPMYKVRLGPFETESEAMRTERLLSHLVQGQSFIIHE